MIAFEKLIGLTPDDQRSLSVIFELHPSAKIRSVPNDATAFNNRGPQHNVLTLCSWKGDTPEDFNATRQAVNALTDIITSFEIDPRKSKTKIYGNYGILFGPTNLS